MAKTNVVIMIFEDLHNRYGAHVARRVQQELTPAELNALHLEDLPSWLERRAEAAHQEYQTRLDNPFVKEERIAAGVSQADMLYRRWQNAEELAYLIAVAEDVSAQAHAASAK
jgi:hypothetical protein